MWTRECNGQSIASDLDTCIKRKCFCWIPGNLQFATFSEKICCVSKQKGNFTLLVCLAEPKQTDKSTHKQQTFHESYVCTVSIDLFIFIFNRHTTNCYCCASPHRRSLTSLDLLYICTEMSWFSRRQIDTCRTNEMQYATLSVGSPLFTNSYMNNFMLMLIVNNTQTQWLCRLFSFEYKKRFGDLTGSHSTNHRADVIEQFWVQTNWHGYNAMTAKTVCWFLFRVPT